MKKALVLGGTNYFGPKLVNHLLDEGWSVTLATRGQKSDAFANRVARVKVERNSVESMGKELGHGEWDIVYDQLCMTEDAAKIATDLFRGRVGKYIMTSTTAVYLAHGRLPESSFDASAYVWDSSDSTGSPLTYSEGKRRAEAIFARWAEFPVALPRFPHVIGPDDPFFVLHKAMALTLARRPAQVWVGTGRFCLIQSAEAARFLFWLIDPSVVGPLNACSNGTIDVFALLNLIEKCTGLKTEIQLIESAT